MKRVRYIALIGLTAGCAHGAWRVPAKVLRFVIVTAGADHACALTEKGEVYCWGSNQFGQLGNGAADSANHATPQRVRSDLPFDTVVAGFRHTCGIARDGSTYCWGANESGQLGDGTLKSKSLPVRVKSDIRFQSIGPGGTHTCGVSADATGYCWGGNWHGQLGEGSLSGDTPCCFLSPVRVRTSLRFRSVVAGGIHTCGVTVDSKAYCWGSPQEGRLGSGEDDARDKTADKTLPTAVLGRLLVATLAPRSWHTCALTPAGGAFCWGGDGGRGVLGSGEILNADPSSPVRVATVKNFAALASGHMHNCALTPDGVAYCWGVNTDGELGDGTTRDRAAPQRVATEHRFRSVATGGNAFINADRKLSTWGFSCGVTIDTGAVLCWGDNRHGELGNGNTNRAIVPAPVSSPDARKGGT